MDRGGWWVPWSHKELDTTEQLTLRLFKCTVLWLIRASLVTQLVRIRLQCRRSWFDSWVRKIH